MELAFKKEVYNACHQLVRKQVVDIREALEDAQSAANNETKSSAGDKHETGRAMAQLETEKLTSQLTEALKTLETIERINPENTSPEIKFGSLAETNNGMFYLSTGLGKVIVDDKVVFAISAISPIGKLLLNKKEKESFSFNGKTFMIKKII
jgi:transcription elongation GreA/GreB family factor